ncbi:MAG: hypothetical protein ABSB58_08750 [Gemmatimonadales bacterium]|jgi:uncharacterized coiled-coil protein SlyX
MAEVLVIVALLAVLGFFRRGSGSAPDLSAWNRTLRDMQAQLDATLTELDQQRAQVAELAERLDFAERRLVQLQTPRSLPPFPPTPPAS